MNRRNLLSLIGGAAVALPLAPVFPQVSKPRLATLAPTSATSSPALWAAFWDGMQALGHRRDDFAVEARWAEGHPERLHALVAELVRLNPRIILCVGSEAGVAAKQETATIPIVLAVSSDPVGAGLVASLARPGGNATGLSLASLDIAGKHVELLKTLVPQAQRIAVLMNPHDPTHAGRAAGIIAAAKSVGADAFAVPAATVDQLDGAYADIARSKADALIILGTPIFNLMANDITKLSNSRKLPVFSDSASAVRLGIGVMGYGADVKDLFRRAAYYVDRILKGAKPGDLPIEQPTKFELVVDLKTAKAIDLTIPQSLLARADEVIE